MRGDHDTFLEGKSMYKLKNDGVEDNAREEKHAEPREEKRGTPGFNIARTTWIYTLDSILVNWLNPLWLPAALSRLWPHDLSSDFNPRERDINCSLFESSRVIPSMSPPGGFTFRISHHQPFGNYITPYRSNGPSGGSWLLFQSN